MSESPTLSSWRQRELSRFLAAKRMALPSDTYRVQGQFTSGRRRVDGLRREELAALTGIGISWYTRLEQGREARISTAVATSLALVLRLSRAETDYLFHLAGLVPPAGQLTEASISPVEPERLLLGLEPTPALVIDGLWNIQCCNESANTLLGLTPADSNLLVWLFTADMPERVYADVADVACNAVAHLRIEAARYFDDAALQRLIADLCEASTKFDELWQAQEIVTPIHSRQRIRGPDGDAAEFHKQTWRLEGGSNLRLLILVPGAS